MRGLFEKQNLRQWGGIAGYEHRQALHGKTMGIVGFGHTGQAVAVLAKAFGMPVIAYRREANTHHELVDTMLSADAGDPLDTLLRQSDVVVLAAGLNDATHHMIGTEQFRTMKTDAFIINMARGGLIDHEALETALKDGAIGGAGLDCTEPEPLPPTSPLWDMPNVILTPHMTPKLPDRTQRSIAVIVENIRRYRSGEPLLNAVTASDRFSAGR